MKRERREEKRFSCGWTRELKTFWVIVTWVKINFQSTKIVFMLSRCVILCVGLCVCVWKASKAILLHWPDDILNYQSNFSSHLVTPLLFNNKIWTWKFMTCHRNVDENVFGGGEMMNEVDLVTDYFHQAPFVVLLLLLSRQ